QRKPMETGELLNFFAREQIVIGMVGRKFGGKLADTPRRKTGAVRSGNELQYSTPLHQQCSSILDFAHPLSPAAIATALPPITPGSKQRRSIERQYKCTCRQKVKRHPLEGSA